MGLGLVESVIAIEDAFETSIPKSAMRAYREGIAPMIKFSGARILSSLLRRVDSLFRVMAIGLALAAVGTALAFALGSHTTGPLADAAVYLTVSGMAVVFTAGSLRFVLVALRLWRRMRD